MQQSLSKKKIKLNYYDFVLLPLFFLLFFLYIWQKVNPVLYYQSQEPIFFLEARFFEEFLGYPGGLLEYLSAFFSQSYYYSWLGALVITIIAFLTSIFSRNIIKSVSNSEQVYILHLVTSSLLLILYTQYECPLFIAIGLLLSLSFFKLYIKFAPDKTLWLLVYYSFLSIIIYYIAAGPSFLFVILCTVYELLFRRKYVASLIFPVFSAIVPYIACKYLFIVSIKEAYINLLAFEEDALSLPESYILYLYMPVILVLTSTIKKLVPEKIREKILSIILLRSKLKYVILPAMIIIGTFLLATNTFDKEKKALLLIDYNARCGNWQEVLKSITPQMLNTKLITCQLNRALYHTNKLSSEMFSYPQGAGTEGLIFSEKLGALDPSLRSDIFFELGHINEAKHWACEALAVKGYTPWNLQRIALTSIIKGEKQTAQKCLNMLNKTLLYGDWVKKYQPFLNDKELFAKDEEMRSFVSYANQRDFIVNPNSPDVDLESMLLSGNSNRMTFEYLMAHYLFKRQLENFVSKIELLPDYGYKNIPRHYEEALLTYDISTDRRDFDIQKYKISSETYQRFNDLQKILHSYNGNIREAAGEIMTKYGNTYWAYLLYNQ